MQLLQNPPFCSSNDVLVVFVGVNVVVVVVIVDIATDAVTIVVAVHEASRITTKIK
jgi:hypothetical protein